MKIRHSKTRTDSARRLRRLLIKAPGFGFLCGIVALSAVVTKEAQSRFTLRALAAIEEPSDPAAADAFGRLVPTGLSPVSEADVEIRDPLVTADAPAEVRPAAAGEVRVETEELPPHRDDLSIRWFNGRPVRPAKTLTMTVTAYSPDERSCGDSADGITSSLHDVWTNATKLVAADSRVLPLGSMITVPGYDTDNIVPVLDRGGAIKGHRLDVLYPTHEQARRWGVRKLKVTVWEYADGKPACDFRAIRDSRN